MDINVRNVNPYAVRKLDELAKSKGVSRSEYVRQMLESVSLLTMRDGVVDRLEKQIEANNIFMKQTNETLDELVSILKELIVDE